LMNKQFREYFEQFANLLKSLQQVEIPNGLCKKEEDSSNAQTHNDSSSQNYDFWSLFGQQESLSSQTVPNRQIDDQLEVWI